MLIKKSMLTSNAVYYFNDLAGYGKNSPVEDDHIPFLKKSNFNLKRLLNNLLFFFPLLGVPILHLIPLPFPPQWHTKNDNLRNLNQNRIQDLRQIMKAFLLQILNVSI